MNHDYRCPECTCILRDQFRTAAQGGRTTAPFCPQCKSKMEWLVPRLRTDLRTDGEGKSGNTFQKFTILDGLNRRVEIDSLSKLRQVERESEKMAADGIGQPIRFRGFAQDHSNMMENTFGEAPTERPSDEAKAKFGKRGGFEQVSGGADGSDPDYSYGPGVSDENTSSLQID